MRVYVPATLVVLTAAVTSGSFCPPRGHGYGVTEGLRAEYPAADEDELEYLAMQDAARTSLRLLAGEGDTASPMRVVVAADNGTARANPVGERSSVLIDGEISWRDVAAVHLDGADAAKAVRAAVEVIHEADLGDPDAEFVLGSAEDFELAWYAPDEVVYLVQELG